VKLLSQDCADSTGAQVVSSPLLIEEPPLQVLPALAIKIGLNEAIVLQQLHYLLRNPLFGRKLGEHRWIFNTYEEWRSRFFPFWSCDTIKRTFGALAKRGLIVSCQPEGRLSRRKHYRVNYEELARIPEQGRLPSSNGADCPLPITKTTYKESKESLKRTADAAGVSFDAVWKPDGRSQQEKLRSLVPPAGMPDEADFNEFLHEKGLHSVKEFREDLYHYLCLHKWHTWDKVLLKWVRIRSWRQFVLGLNGKLPVVDFVASAPEIDFPGDPDFT
jgi:hypothetical protein